MVHIPISQEWFFGLTIAFELLFAVAAFAVASYAFRVYYISRHRESKLFTYSFTLISVSYLLKALLNLFVYSELKEKASSFAIEGLDKFITNLNKIQITSYYLYILLFTAGLITLAYMTFRVKSWKVYTILIVTNLLAIYLSDDKSMLLFSLLSSLLVLYVCFHYLFEYMSRKNNKTLLLLIAFVAMFFSGLAFVFTKSYYGNYAIGHALELASYILIITSLVLTVRKN